MKRQLICTCAVIALVAAGSSPALAQDNADPVIAAGEEPTVPSPDDNRQTTVGEIVVTAQKRAENVQDVPIAITAISADLLASRGIQEISQISAITPNATLDAGTPFSGSDQVLAAFIRGIGANDFAANLDPGVGVYLDGVYLARTVGANLSLPDVERVEILKGPQGTLFGRNTIGGAISVVTRDPGHEFAIRGDATVGRFNRFGARASVDLPVSDTVRTSLTFATDQRDGYQKRVPFPTTQAFVSDDPASFPYTGYRTSDREGGADSWSVRGKVLFEASDRLEVRLIGDYTRVDTSSSPNSVLTVDPAFNFPNNFAGIYNTCINTPTAVLTAIGLGQVCGPRGTSYNPSRQIGGLGGVNVDADPFNDRHAYDNRFLSPDPDVSYATGNSFNQMESWGLSGIVDFEVTPGIELKSITGYRELDWGVGVDLDGSPTQALEGAFSLNQSQFSQELQLLGSFLDDALNVVLGGYYFKEDAFLLDSVMFGQGLLQVVGPSDLGTENFAFFGQVDWRINDLIGITVGGRYTEEDKTFIGGQRDENGFIYKLFGLPISPAGAALAGFPVPSEPLRFYVDTLNEKKFSNFSPKVGVQLHPSEDVMVYGSYSQGYKTGGWTTRLSAPLNFAPDFNEEKAKTWEIGIKSQLLDRRLQLNAAVFSTDYEDIQLTFTQGVSPTFQNAGNARIKGFEVELQAVPVEGLNINGSVGYIDSKFTEVLPGAVVPPNLYQLGVNVGSELPKTPEWQLNLSPSYTVDLGNSGEIRGVVSWTHTTRVYNDVERTLLLSRPKNDMLDASITYEAPGGDWALTGGVTNILDERVLVSGAANLGAGIIFGTYNRPREWYLRLGFDF